MTLSTYKLTANAKEDLYRIYEYGVTTFGKQQADTYFAHLTAAFADIADTVPESKLEQDDAFKDATIPTPPTAGYL
ncbi:type II toxin-antitoxin system RelE/ParE family toxin [Idiomarina piscisalsi]|uniref:type II toxin-antitoxin system RelE/ParE family toxin n=1 Tax=Idiomarina piscisalsi TaxID=1096243 RepID=UPI0036301BD6